GYVRGTLIVPKFVLAELQYFNDSPDGSRRERGRRGLEMLARMQKEETVKVELSEEDPAGNGADGKLVTLAKSLGVAIMTNDYGRPRRPAGAGVVALIRDRLGRVPPDRGRRAARCPPRSHRRDRPFTCAGRERRRRGRHENAVELGGARGRTRCRRDRDPRLGPAVRAAVALRALRRDRASGRDRRRGVAARRYGAARGRGGRRYRRG